MKQTLILAALLVLALAGCSSPQPLPVAPTKIPTLPPATLPPAVTPTPRPAAVGITFPASAPSAAAGEAIYTAKCAACHGADGKAQVAGARNFTDVDYIRAAIPAEFYRVITKGKEQMPGFEKDLSDQERWNVTFYIWHFAVPQAALAKGKTIFEANCVSCHGPDGKGLIPQAAPLTNVEYVASRSLTEFYQSVTAGKGIMPPWQDRLSPEERWAAVEYAQAFAYQPLGK
ncbi:MAG: c-type cytochrome [Anaerolineae bacterium]|nr:c-type cytochrome [Anaerolineae bacterium]